MSGTPFFIQLSRSTETWRQIFNHTEQTYPSWVAILVSHAIARSDIRVSGFIRAIHAFFYFRDANWFVKLYEKIELD